MTQPLRSIRAKLIESVREYCAEHFLRPYIWVDVDDAVRGLELTDELLTFEARFGDSVEPMQVVVPLNRIVHAAPAETPEEGASFMVKPTHPDLRAEILGEEKPAETVSAPQPHRPMRIK